MDIGERYLLQEISVPKTVRVVALMSPFCKSQAVR